MKNTLVAVMFALALPATTTWAQTLYKSIGPDGKAVYGDKPPVDGRLEKTLKVESLPNTALPPNYLAELQTLRKAGVKAPPPTTGTILYAASWCGYCKLARSYLASKNVSYEEVDIDTPSGKSAFAAVGGGGGVPLLVLKGQKVRGFSAQAYDQLFAGHR
jgi:glutaredoxin